MSQRNRYRIVSSYLQSIFGLSGRCELEKSERSLQPYTVTISTCVEWNNLFVIFLTSFLFQICSNTKLRPPLRISHTLTVQKEIRNRIILI